MVMAAPAEAVQVVHFILVLTGCTMAMVAFRAFPEQEGHQPEAPALYLAAAAVRPPHWQRKRLFRRRRRRRRMRRHDILKELPMIRLLEHAFSTLALSAFLLATHAVMAEPSCSTTTMRVEGGSMSPRIAPGQVI